MSHQQMPQTGEQPQVSREPQVSQQAGVEMHTQGQSRGIQGTTTGQQGGGPQLQGQQFQTRTTIPERAQQESIQRLNQCLADTTVLLSQARYAHWNVKGPNFYALHELFEDLAEELEDHEDDIAERVTSLGGQALGSASKAVQNSRIQPLPESAVGGMEFISALVDRLAIHDQHLYDAIQSATQSGDVDTADLLNEVSRDVGKYIWFLEAHLQSQQRGQPAGVAQQYQGQVQGVGTQQAGSETQATAAAGQIAGTRAGAGGMQSGATQGQSFQRQ